MDAVVMLILRSLIRWIRDNPESRVTRFMLAPRGPRTDPGSMTRIDRLKSSLTFLLWGAVFFGLLTAWSYACIEWNMVDSDGPLFMAILFGLVIFAGMGIVGGFYMLLRDLI